MGDGLERGLARIAPKFRPIRIEGYGEAIPEDPGLGSLKYWCVRFHEEGLAPPYEEGSFGNLSVRLDVRGLPEPEKWGNTAFIITASKSSLRESTENDRFLVVRKVDFEKKIVYYAGSKVWVPSSESMLHYGLYQFREDAGAAFHGHSGIISSAIRDLGIPETSEEEPYGTVGLVERSLDVLRQSPGLDFFEMKNHGFVSLGRTPEEAGETAMRYLERARGLGRRVRV